MKSLEWIFFWCCYKKRVRNVYLFGETGQSLDFVHFKSSLHVERVGTIGNSNNKSEGYKHALVNNYTVGTYHVVLLGHLKL